MLLCSSFFWHGLWSFLTSVSTVTEIFDMPQGFQRRTSQMSRVVEKLFAMSDGQTTHVKGEPGQCTLNFVHVSTPR